MKNVFSIKQYLPVISSQQIQEKESAMRTLQNKYRNEYVTDLSKIFMSNFHVFSFVLKKKELSYFRTLNLTS